MFSDISSHPPAPHATRTSFGVCTCSRREHDEHLTVTRPASNASIPLRKRLHLASIQENISH